MGARRRTRRTWRTAIPKVALVLSLGLLLQILPTAPAVHVRSGAVAIAAETTEGTAEPTEGTAEGGSEEPSSDPDPVALAQEEAAVAGEPVEVEALRTEASTTYANGDGTLTVHLYAGPIRVRDEGGAWADIDTTLVADASGVRPVAAKAALRFSPGGEGELARLAAGAKAFAVSWGHGVLPAPELAGPVATYREVLPGADLELEALPNGYAERVVLRERPTEPLVLRFPVTLEGLAIAQDRSGRITLADAVDDRLVAVADPAFMWGATRDPRSDEPTHQAPVEVRLVTDPATGALVLEVAPDFGFLTDPSVSLPITIDPSPVLTTAADTYVQSDSSSSKWTDTILKSGTYNGGGVVARSFLRYDTSTLAGKHILAASLDLYEHWSYSCSAREVRVYRLTSGFDSTTVWSNQPSMASTVYSSQNVAYGYSSSCPANWVQFPVASLVQEWANGTANYGVAIRAATETDSYGWKKFHSSDHSYYRPYLAVTYNSYPDVPTSLSPASGSKLKTLTPTLSGKFSDADGGSGKLQFEVYRNSDGTFIVSGWGGSVTSGSISSWAVPSGKLSSEVTYKWRARAYDGTDYSGWTSYLTFTPDVTAPAAPSVSSSTHPDQTKWYPNDDPAFSWSASDPTGIAGYSYVFDQTSGTTPDTTSEGTGTTKSYADKADGVWYFHIRAVDGAGNWGATRHFKVQIDDTAPAAPSVSSSTHPDQTKWYPNDDPSFSWTASDTSGIAGYSYLLDQSSGTTPDTTSEGTGTTKSYANLADGVHWFHIRAQNGSGMWGATRHYKVQVDDTAPAAPALSSSTHPDQDRWYTPSDGPAYNDPSFSWSASDTSGIAGYSYVLDQSSGTTPDTTSEGTGTTASYTDVGAGGSGVFFFHVRAQNGAGLWGPTSHWRVQIDSGNATFTDPGPETTLQGQVTLRATTGPNATGVRFEHWTGTAWTALGAGTESPDNTWSYVWNTAALDGGGNRLYPNGPYQLRVVPVFTGGDGNPVPGPLVTVDDARLGANPWWTFLEVGGGAQVNAATGNVVVVATDVSLPTGAGAIAFVRTYNSQGAQKDGPLGWGWELALPLEGAPAAYTALTRVTDPDGDGVPDSDYVEVADVTGESLYFLADEAGAWVPEPGAEGMTLLPGAGEWVLTDTEGSTYRFRDAGADLPGELLEARPPAGGGASYGYDASGRLTSVTDPTGHKRFTLAYDAAGHLVEVRAAFDGDQPVASYAYDAGGNLVTVTDPRTGLSWAYGYAGHLLTSITPPGLTPIRLAYQTTTTGRLGEVRRTLPGGSGEALTTLAYGTWAEGAQTTVRGPRGNQAADGSFDWVYRFDGSSRVRLVVPPAGPAQETRWDARNHEVYSQTPAEAAAGTATTRAYSDTEACNLSGAEGANDGADLCRVTGPAQDVRNPDGTTSVISPVTAYRYDEGLGGLYHLLTRQDNPDGTYLVYEYDQNGLAAHRPNRQRTYSPTGALLETRSFTYDASGRTLTEVLPKGHVAGETPAEHTIGFSYHPDGDAIQGGYLASISRPGAPTRTFTYNVWGSRLTEGWPLGTTAFGYDSAQRLTSSTAPGESTRTTAYHSSTGLVASVGDTSGTVARTYDTWGRVTSETDALGAATTFSYDRESNLVSRADQWGTTSFSYDVLNRPVEVADPVGVTSISYRADGSIDTVALPNGVTATYTARSGAGDLDTLTYQNASGLLGVFDRDYDRSGQVVRDVRPDVTREYAYDGLGRLVEATDRDPSTGELAETRTYAFDANTNRTSFTTTPAGGTATTVSYAYDPADRLTEVLGGPNPGTFSYDANGNTLAMPGRTLTWSGENRLREATQGTTTVTYGLDPLGRTLTRAVTEGGTTTSASTHHYATDSDTPTWTVDDQGGTQAITRYVQGPGGLLAVQAVGGATTFPLTNPHGDLWANTDGTGAITATFTFDEYGQPLQGASGDPATDRYGFLARQQREWDPTVGLVLMGVRAYDPALGRFLSVDPVQGGSANDYDYVYGDPVNGYDLDGRTHLKKLPLWMKVFEVAKLTAGVLVAFGLSAFMVWAVVTACIASTWGCIAAIFPMIAMVLGPWAAWRAARAVYYKVRYHVL